ncbi:MAG TPA: DUF5996 family protein [Mycobacteriales bacterium]|nr:DUF5996 family protein [Mycobacteriales bacterium]
MRSETAVGGVPSGHSAPGVPDPTGGPWPELPWQAWRSTADTLHMFSQVLGKFRLALAPPEPSWGHVPLAVTVTGLSTGPMTYGTQSVQVDLDLTDHRLRVAESGGSTASFPLTDRSVAAFYTEVMAVLADLGVRIELNPMPQEVPDPTPFPADTGHHDYDPAWVRRFHRVLLSVAGTFTRFRAGYRGPHSRVGLFWGTFDLAYTRFSGRPAAPPPGSNLITRGAMDAELWSCGFWPGDDDSPAPIFFCYSHPRPDGLDTAPVRPDGAGWNGDLGEFVLPYDAVRHEPSPHDAVLSFLASTFHAASQAGRWPGAPR